VESLEKSNMIQFKIIHIPMTSSKGFKSHPLHPNSITIVSRKC
jgi:predicted metallopeptidase